MIDKIQKFPLTPTQRDMALSSILFEEAGTYIQQVSIELETSLDIAIVREVWSHLTRKHEMLRASLHLETDSKPFLQIAPECEVDVEELVLSKSANGELLFNKFLEHDRTIGFNLSKAPLARIRIANYSINCATICFTYHHCILDGPSRRKILQEFLESYHAVREEIPVAETEPPTYCSFGNWLKDTDLSSNNAYWRKQSNLNATSGELRGDIASNSETDNIVIAHDVFELSFNSVEMAAIGQYIKQTGNNLPTTVIAAWAILLARYGNLDDVCLGLVRSGRGQLSRDHSDVVGSLISVLPIAVDLSNCLECGDVQNRIRELVKQSRSLEHSCLQEINRAAGRANSQTIFDSVIVINRETDFYQLSKLCPDFGIQSIEVREQPDVPLMLQIYTDPCLQFRLYFQRQQYGQEFAKGLLGHLKNIIWNIVHYGRDWRQLQLLDNQEFQMIVKDWNGTQLAYDSSKSMVELFEEQVLLTPDQLAIIDGDSRITYQELNDKVNRLANYILSNGFQPGQNIGICVNRSIRQVVAILAILKAGGVYVPLDPDYPKARLKFMIRNSEATLLISEQELFYLFSDFDGITVDIDNLDVELKAMSRENPGIKISGEDPFYIIYTSGSTGTPKGVVGLHKGALNRFNWMWRLYPFEPDEVCCLKTRISFVDSVWEIFGPLLRGIKIVIISDQCTKDPELFVHELSSHKVTRLVLVPSLLQSMLSHVLDLDSQLSHLKLCITSGEYFSDELYLSFKERLPGCRILNLYGSSEVSADVTSFDSGLGDTARAVSIGKPIDNTKVHILDRYMNPVPIGVVGEIYIEGDGLAQGYYKQPKMNEDRFIENGLNRNAKLFKTGDLARFRQDGDILFVGRVDSQIKIRGQRFELGEIENVLDRLEAIRASVVIVTGSSNPQLIAFLILQNPETGKFLTELIREHVRTFLPSFMVPSKYTVINEFPHTPSGKIDRVALRDMKIKDPSSRSKIPDEHLSITERRLVEIWKTVLDSNSVSSTENFFDIGGHSLLAVELMAKINKKFDRKLPVVTLVEAPTIRRLSQRLEQDKSKTKNSVVQIKEGNKDLTPIFLVHDVEGEAILYRELAYSIKDDRSVYALQPHGNEEYPILHVTIEDMAAHYLNEIRRIQPTGPYLLGGLCAGGVVAFEMACQLQESDQEVQWVFLLDALEPSVSLLTARWKKRLSRLTGDVSWERTVTPIKPGIVRRNLPEQFNLIFRKCRNVFVYEIQEFFRNQMFKAKVNRYADFVKNKHQLPDGLKNISVSLIYKFARKKYVPGVFNGNILLVRATEATKDLSYNYDDSPMREIAADPLFGWGLRAVQEIYVEDTPGGHSTMLQKPYVRTLGSKIEQYISETNESGRHQLSDCSDASVVIHSHRMV